VSEIDEILGTNNNRNYYTTNRNYNNKNNKQKNNDWREKQNRERQDIYDTMDRMAFIVSDDGSKFQEYLDVQSRFPKYSVGNSLVILEKFPQATQIKDENSWNEKGIQLKSNAKAVKILEPVQSNGVTYFNPKDVYDITQTNAEQLEQEKHYGDRKLLEALLHECNVPRKAVDILPNGSVGSEYDKNENVLYVCKGMDRELLFQSLSQEMGNIEMKDEENSNIKSFKSYCVSYMFCKRYGIDVSNYNFDNLPEELTTPKDGKGIRFELDKVKTNFEKINSRMTDYFEQSSKEKNKSVPER
jgi:hypothetical protein